MYVPKDTRLPPRGQAEKYILLSHFSAYKKTGTKVFGEAVHLARGTHMIFQTDCHTHMHGPSRNAGHQGDDACSKLQCCTDLTMWHIKSFRSGAPKKIRSAATDAIITTSTNSFSTRTNTSGTTYIGDFRFIAPVTGLPDILVRPGCQAQTTG